MAEAIHEVGSRGDLTEADVASAPLLLSVLLMIFHEEIPKAGRAQRRKRVRIQDWLVHDELPSSVVRSGIRGSCSCAAAARGVSSDDRIAEKRAESERRGREAFSIHPFSAPRSAVMPNEALSREGGRRSAVHHSPVSASAHSSSHQRPTIDERGGGPITNMPFYRSIVRCLRDRRRDAAKVMSRLTREGVGFLDLPLHPSLPPRFGAASL